MKIINWLSQWQRYEEFPITKSKVFLAHAAISPFPRRVSAAIQNYSQSNSVIGQWEYLYGETEKETRRLAAVLLGGNEDEIAFVSSTSMGLSLIASGLSWQKGDNIIIADGDFPSNIYPWLNLSRLGVQTKLIPRRESGAVFLDDIEETVDDNTRLVSLSSVNFITGFRLDVDAIGEYLHRRGILFCIDAVQSLGVLPFDSTHVDFAASSAHKWLLGPMGIGILFVKKSLFEKVHPALAGWKSVTNNKKYLSYHLDFLDSAKRYEPGTVNGLGLVGLHAALEILTEVGVENIASRLEGFRGALVSSLAEMGYEVLSPTEPDKGSAIVSFTSNEQSIPELRQRLDSAGFIVSLRDALDGRKCIRIAPHFYNTEEEIAALLDELRPH